MRAPLLSGQPAPVIPFAVLTGRKRAEPTGEARLAELRRTQPDLAGVVDRIIARYLGLLTDEA